MNCPVCGKKVGEWHKDGVHPKCREAAMPELPAMPASPDGSLAGGIRAMTQKQRDAILRRLNTK